MDKSVDCSCNLYLNLNSECKQLIIIANKNQNGGLLYSENGVLALDTKSFEIIYKAFVSAENYTLDSLITNKDEQKWINSLLKNPLFDVVKSKPCKKVLPSYEIESSKEIRTCYTTQSVILNYPQSAIEVLFNDIIIYYILSEQDTPDLINSQNPANSFVYNNNSTEIYPSVNLHPVLNTQSLGSACTSCSQCSACYLCTLCAITFITLSTLSIYAQNCTSTVTCS